MSAYCANCTNEADYNLAIKECDKPVHRLLLCSLCKDAFDWGVGYGNASIEELDVEQEEEAQP